MSGAEAQFELDPRLAADTAFVDDWRLCCVLLMDDARFTWLILVPRRAHAVELDDLTDADQAILLSEINRAMELLRVVSPCDKLNVGALGNIVRQLHVHVIARREDDAAWPGPVWGHAPAQPYGHAQRDALIAKIRSRSF